jgi:hypothetical protein
MFLSHPFLLSLHLLSSLLSSSSRPSLVLLSPISPISLSPLPSPPLSSPHLPGSRSRLGYAQQARSGIKNNEIVLSGYFDAPGPRLQVRLYRLFIEVLIGLFEVLWGI